MVFEIYNDQSLQDEAWEHAQTWPSHILDGLTDEDVNGKDCCKQNISCMLDQVEDLGSFNCDEWIKFFETVRVEGI